MEVQTSCGAIIIHGKNILIIKDKRANNWSFPKGRVQAEETPQQTAIREVKEEVGLDINIIKGFCEVSKFHIGKAVDKTVYYFLAIVETDKIIRQEKEIAIAQWVPLSEVENYLRFDNGKRIIKKVKEYLELLELSNFFD
ncbi:MAG: bis(5'-nucleosidyl)-tetraphosphatase [Candidatus Woesearchaeota archaeon]|jgi:bis(5'-nucleosidyl)-tetraphosphatase